MQKSEVRQLIQECIEESWKKKQILSKGMLKGASTSERAKDGYWAVNPQTKEFFWYKDEKSANNKANELGGKGNGWEVWDFEKMTDL